jgi:hypothetical protein
VLAAVAGAAPLRAEITGGLVDGTAVHHALTLALTSPELEASGFDPLGAVLQAARARAGLDRPELLSAPDGAGVTPLARVRARRARAASMPATAAPIEGAPLDRCRSRPLSQCLACGRQHAPAPQLSS